MELLTFLEAKKWAKTAADGMRTRKLAVLGEFATQHLCTALRGVAAKNGIALDIFEADYDQIELQLLDAASATYASAPEDILILPCTEKLYRDFTLTPESERSSFAEKQFTKLCTCWKSAAQNTNAMLLQASYMEKDDRVFGNYGSKTESSFIFQLRKLNWLICAGAAKNEHIAMIDLSWLRTVFTEGDLRDPKLYYMAKLPFALDVLPALGQLVTDVIRARMGMAKKCVILDLDNTLWGGVVGDDGYENIQIGDLGTGQAFSAFQRWLKELKRRGVLLAVCSKNEEEAAKEPFLKNPDMVLRLEDISLFVANWKNKAANIVEMQKTLNIGMDSIVFIDDNPFERESVRQLVPQLTVPEMPKDPAQYVDYLEGLNLFETISFSEEDARRTDQYRSEMSRKQAQSSFASFDEYLISLNMKAEGKPFDAYHVPRIAQLSQRSNQFNLRTIRYSEGEVRQISENGNYLTLYFTLTDKFGEYGLISAVILEKRDENTLFVDTWFMSCRVLKRGMEEFILNSMVKTAREAGFRKLIGEYIPTAKNAMVRELYPSMGFLGTDRPNVYCLDTMLYKPLPTNILEVKE